MCAHKHTQPPAPRAHCRAASSPTTKMRAAALHELNLRVKDYLETRRTRRRKFLTCFRNGIVLRRWPHQCVRGLTAKYYRIQTARKVSYSQHFQRRLSTGGSWNRSAVSQYLDRPARNSAHPGHYKQQLNLIMKAWWPSRNRC